MFESLDSTVAQVVFAARRLEKAVHDQGPWTMTWAGRTVPARRFLTDTGVIFGAEFSEHCHLAEPDPTVTLECDGEVVAVREIAFPGDGAFDLQWAIEGQAINSFA